MKIKRLVIENFKSIERVELIEPNPFTVFVGPNGSGKSNIFEALEFSHYVGTFGNPQDLFGGNNKISHRKLQGKRTELFFEISETNEHFGAIFFGGGHSKLADYNTIETSGSEIESKLIKSFETLWFRQFTKLFVNNPKGSKINFDTSERIRDDAKNLEPVLKRILTNSILQDEISEWLELFIPGFKAVEVDDRDELRWFEESTQEYFTKDLISDGTYNILALLTAVYQSKEPQFLCIEEPENGLHPDVIKEFVNLCRYACEEFGHYIWLNTHSQTLASQLTSDEIVVVDKINGATQTKQFKGHDFHGLRMDEAWLMNALGGGLPW
ncbi:AAA family ATPase [Spirosoma litoris]